MAELDPGVKAVYDAVLAESLQDQRAVQRRAQQHAEHMLQLTQGLVLGKLMGDAQVASSYRGNHLKKGAEVDAQEALAEDIGYGQNNQNSLQSLLAQLGATLGAIQQQMKVVQTSPPETAK